MTYSKSGTNTFHLRTYLVVGCKARAGSYKEKFMLVLSILIGWGEIQHPIRMLESERRIKLFHFRISF